MSNIEVYDNSLTGKEDDGVNISEYQKYNDYFNKNVQDLLDNIGVIKSDPSTSNALRGLLVNISHSSQYYPDIEMILADLKSGKTLDQSLDTQEKIEIFNILKSNFFKISKNKIKKQEKVLGPNIVNQLTSICESKYFKDIDTLAFDCDMSHDELDEYILLSGMDPEISVITQQIQDDFSEKLNIVIPAIIKKLEKRNVDFHKVVSEFPNKIKKSLNAFNRPSSSYLNAHISRIEDRLMYKYFLFLYIKLSNKNNVDYYYSKHSNIKFTNGAIGMGIYFNQVKEFNKNNEITENVEQDEIVELEEKISQLGSIKKVKPGIIKTNGISISIIPHETIINESTVSNKFTYLFTVGINFSGNEDFGFFRGIYIGKDLLSVNQANNKSSFLTLNSEGKLCVGGSKSPLSFINFRDSNLKKIIFTALIDYLENEEEFLDSFFLNEQDLLDITNKNSEDNQEIEAGITNYEYHGYNDTEEDKNHDVNENETIVNKHLIRQAFNTLKGYPVNKIYKRFIKVLGEPIRSTGGSHVVFHSDRTNKNFPFSKHGSSGSQNIGIGLLSKYLKNSGICPTELI